MVFENSNKIDYLLSKTQLQHVIKESLKEKGIDQPWTLKNCDLKTSTDVLRGFLGDHSNVSLDIAVGDQLVTIHLFVKKVPIMNKPKAELIEDFNFFKKEMIMYRLFEDMESEGSAYWHPKVYWCDEKIVVMPDLCVENYKQVSPHHPLDLDHVMATVESLAKLHAASYNLETKRRQTNKQTYTIIDGYKDLFEKCTFTDTPWMRAGAKLTTNILKTFSVKFSNFPTDLETVLKDLYLQACGIMKIYENTINTLIHKDLWVNNIMYKYENGDINALLIDFQCARYGPPAFDLMTFLYLTTSRHFRRQYEDLIIRHYYTTFIHNLQDISKDRANSFGYSLEDFRSWCEKARMFGLLEAVAIFPYIMMDPKNAKIIYDDPKTFEHYSNVDRSEPVIAYANITPIYRERNLEVSEEFYERYVLKVKG